MKVRPYKWKIQYNNQDIGKIFKTKTECKKEWNRLDKLGLFGYTISKINN